MSAADRPSACVAVEGDDARECACYYVSPQSSPSRRDRCCVDTEEYLVANTLLFRGPHLPWPALPTAGGHDALHATRCQTVDDCGGGECVSVHAHSVRDHDKSPNRRGAQSHTAIANAMPA